MADKEKESDIIHPKLDPKKFSHEELLQRFQKIQSFCLQAGTCVNIGNGNPGLDCALKDGQSDRRCFVHDPNLPCPLNEGGKNYISRERKLEEIRKALNSRKI